MKKELVKVKEKITRTSYVINSDSDIILEKLKDKGITKDAAINALIAFGGENLEAFLISFGKQTAKSIENDSKTN